MATRHVPRPESEPTDERAYPVGALPWQVVIRLAHQRALGEE